MVLVGPSGSGKRHFLASLDRSYESHIHPEWTRFRSNSDLAASMNTSAASAESREPASPPTSGMTYTFQLGFQSPGARTASGTAIEELEASVLVTPGRFFETLAGEGSSGLDGDWLQDLVRASRIARCLVFCVDGARASTNRKLNLAGVISRLLGVGPRLLRRVGAKPWPARDSPWERTPRLELPFERVLVLLSGIEVLCNEAARRLGEIDRKWLFASPAELRCIEALGGIGPRRIAESLDLWPLAEDRIDGLDLLASSLKPGATFGVCGISTAGLEWPQGRRLNLSSLDPGSNIDFGPGEPRPVPSSAPFGIWPSLLFMTTGRVVTPLATFNRRSRGPVPQRWIRLGERSGGRP